MNPASERPTRVLLALFSAISCQTVFAFESAPLRITAGAAPSSLVARYVVTWSAGPNTGKAAAFGPDGGVLEDVVPAGVASMKVDFAVDFTTDSRIPSYVYHIDQPVNGNAINLIYKPMTKTFGLVAELPKKPCTHDDILVQWTYTFGGRTVSFERLTTFETGPRSNTFLSAPVCIFKPRTDQCNGCSLGQVQRTRARPDFFYLHRCDSCPSFQVEKRRRAGIGLDSH